MSEKVGILIIASGVATLVGWALQQRLKAVKAPKTPDGNPLPRVVHAVLPEATTRHRRVVILGDVHGCPAELQRLLDRLEYRKGVDVLLSVGDLVNKGPDSPEVLRLARANGMLAVRGNHDEAALAAFLAWLDGRGIAKPKKHFWVEQLEAGSGELLRELPFTLELPAYNILLVHAGLVPGVTKQLQRLWDMVKMRDVEPASGAGAPFDWQGATKAFAQQAAAAAAGAGAAGSASGGEEGRGPGSATAAGGSASGDGGAVVAAASQAPQAGFELLAVEEPSPCGRAWASVWPGPQHVFFGHDARRRLQLQQHATGLDTGCVYGGQLTACVLPPLDEEGRPMEQRAKVPPGSREVLLGTGLTAYLVQVPAAEVYCPKYDEEMVLQPEAEGSAATAAEDTKKGV